MTDSLDCVGAGFTDNALAQTTNQTKPAPISSVLRLQTQSILQF
ncbi:MAG: hypothetical protein RIM23_30415 [Coleofasciculus sp. G3-WIS-01]